MDLLDQTPIIATQVLPESPDLTPPPPPSKKSRFVPIIAALFIAIALSVAALFSYKYFTFKSPPVISPTPTPTATLTPSPKQTEVIIEIPLEGEVIESPVVVKGTAPKGWTFESILNISIEDDKHQLLSGGPVSTEEIDGSDNLVSFETAINFDFTTDTGYITIKNDNPSGLAENDKSFSLPIKFVP